MSDHPKTTHPHWLKLRVDWSDLDVFDHVNNVAYFKYIQAARIELCTKAGFSWDGNSTSPGFVVASTKCDYLLPLSYPDYITVYSRITQISNSSFEVEHMILNGKAQIVAVGLDVLVAYDLKKAVKLPIDNALRTSLETFQSAQ